MIRKNIVFLICVLNLIHNTSIGKNIDYIIKIRESPIKYSDDLNEYYLTFTQTGEDGSKTILRFPIQYDPFTGKKLENSKRASVFHQRDEVEVKAIQQEMRQFRSLQEIINRYGQPDKVWKNLHSDGSLQYDFKTSYQTIELSVIVYDENNVDYIISSKEIPEN